MTYTKKTSGFTLIEMIIVMSIIMILLGIGMFPYGYYMQRAYTERSADGLAQEWVLAHKSIRSWLEFDPLSGKHAHLFFVFEKGKSEIVSYIFSGSVNMNTFQYPNLANLSNPNIKKYKTYPMENGIELLGFSGSLMNLGDRIGYMIFPPLWEGLFFTGISLPWITTQNARINIGYPWASIDTGRAKQLLLRTYLK
jgi:prepilin-type N-terminal cleavage/methylation domain-containing protein